MFVEAELLPEPVRNLLHSILVILQSFLEVIRHLFAEGGVGLDCICEDDRRPLVGGVASELLEFLPILESSDIEVQLGLVFEGGQIRGFYRSNVVLCHDAGTGRFPTTSTALAGKFVASFTALTRPPLAALTLVTRILLTAPATLTLRWRLFANSALAETTLWCLLASLAALTECFLALLARAGTLFWSLLTALATSAVQLGLLADITVLWLATISSGTSHHGPDSGPRLPPQADFVIDIVQLS